VTLSARQFGATGLAVAVAALLIAGVVISIGFTRSLQASAEALAIWVRSFGAGAWLIFAGLQVLVAASGVLPASLLGLAAGTLFGIGYGFALAAISTVAGAWLGFCLSRSTLRDMLGVLFRRQTVLRNLDALVARDGWRLVLLLRLSPIMPFAATSYALGLSSVRSRDYLLGTLAALPALFGYVVVGWFVNSSIAAPDPGAHWLQRALFAAGVIATLAISLRLWRMVGLSRVGMPGKADNPIDPL
jgi:uncharacterized membrane protein YdjX (TVP38/TMEM64 family)